MRSVIFSAATALVGLAVLGMATDPAEAQQLVKPKQDCQQLAGIQPNPGSPQDQSCNTVFQDPDLVQALTFERIEVLVNASPSLPDGPFRRLNTHLDYLVLVGQLNGSSGTVAPEGNQNLLDQIGADGLAPGVSISVGYTVQNLSGGKTKVTLTDTSTGGNQILNGCFDGVMFVKNGGKQQIVTAIGEIDMWYLDGATEECGLVYTVDHLINQVVFFYAMGPSGFFTPAGISTACGLLNIDQSAQQNTVSHIFGGQAASGDGLPPATNITGCFGDGASYCDAGEAEGLFNACRPVAGQALVGGANAATAVASGPPVTPPGLSVAAQAIELLAIGGNDQTTTFGGQEGGGSLITCCNFPTFP